MAAFLLVPSPLLGPATWSPVAERLGAEVVPTAGVRSGGALVEAVVAAAGRLAGGVVLVPHSNAGLAAPAVAQRVDVAATVYVDAALPVASPTPLAPPGFLDFLRGLADDDGLLPPWTDWWDDLTGVFPTAAARSAVEAEQPRLALDYFTATLPVPAGWHEQPAAYVAFGDTYAEEVSLATGWGWPVRVLPGRHLHQLHDPDGVAEAVRTLAETLTA